MFLILVYMVIFAGIGYYFGRQWFDNPEREKLFDNMQKLLNCQKKYYKGKQPKAKDLDIDMAYLRKRKSKRSMDKAFGSNATKLFEKINRRADDENGNVEMVNQ